LGKAHVYGVRNYRAAGLCRRGGELTHHEFRSAPVLDDGIVRVGADDRGRTAFAPEKSFHKPDNRMLDRIRKNLAAAQRDKKFDAIRIMDKVKQLRPGVVRPRAEPFAQRDDGTRVLSRIADRPRRAVGGTPFGTEAAPRSPPVRDLNFFNRTVERTEVRNPRRPHPAAPVSTGPLSPGG